jgi:uncharacterized protein
MPFETAKKIVNFGFQKAPSGQTIDFSFFGGEPLLCFKLIQNLTRYIREKESESGKPVRLSMTTNGTLLTEKKLVFLREQDIDLCISIDGPQHIHDLNRLYADGCGSFADVMEKLELAKKNLNSFQVNAVYGPRTLSHLPETLDFFCKIGASSIHLNPDISATWQGWSYAKIVKVFEKVARYYVQNYQRKNELALNIIDNKIVLFLKGGYDKADKCGMGKTEWGFSPDGSIYPCERFVGKETTSPLCLGNINGEIDNARLGIVREHTGNNDRKCHTCSYQRYCMNWCGCTNYFMAGKTDSTSQFLCNSERATIDVSKQVFLSLEEDPLFLEHFWNYLNEEHAKVLRKARLDVR